MLLFVFIGLFSSISAYSLFAEDQLIFWRQSGVGISVPAFWLASLLVDTPMILALPVVYALVYHFLAAPAIPIVAFVRLLWTISFSASGYGYVLSLLLPRSNGVLATAILMIIMGTFLCGAVPGIQPSEPVMDWIT
jgi:hypothetical protein